MITYREKADEGVPIYQPAGFKGQAKVGAVGEEMTDGRLTLKVAGVKRTIYASMGYGGYGSSSLPPSSAWLGNTVRRRRWNPLTASSSNRGC